MGEEEGEEKAKTKRGTTNRAHNFCLRLFPAIIKSRFPCFHRVAIYDDDDDNESSGSASNNSS